METLVNVCPWLRDGFWRTACGLAFAFATVSAFAQAPAAPAPTLDDQAATHLWWGDFEALEKLRREIDGPGKRDANGLALIQTFRSGVGRVIADQEGSGDRYLIELDALTLQWATERPMSPLAHVLHARTLAARAWAYRGDGFANTVAPENLKLFRLYLERAAQHLSSVDAVIQGDSSGHRELLVVARGLSLDLEQQWRIAERGLRANPDDIGLWSQLLTATLPKWLGDADEVDRLIKRAVQATRAQRGEDLYARLYADAADEEFSRGLFEDSRADWTRMKKGFRDMLERWPSSAYNWNRFAYMACLAQDREALSEALDKVGDKPQLGAWGSNARRTFEGCQKLARRT